jgi:murein DD-endopeptidase MepM/ murein hydrolase activator NlpD
MGDAVQTGQVLAECGNSGNSTQPHVHVQVTDGPDMTTARARPMSFRPFREWVRGAGEPVIRDDGVPEERSVVEPLPLV